MSDANKSTHWVERNEFWVWWHDSGSKITFVDGEDHLGQIRRIAEYAWCAAMYQKRSAIVYERALRLACKEMVKKGVAELPDTEKPVDDDTKAAFLAQEYVEWADSEIPKIRGKE